MLKRNCGALNGRMDVERSSRRPGGRTARVRAQVLDAASELIAEGGSERLSIGRIADRSGVHHATVYRRWGSVQGVLVDLASERLAVDSPIPDTGTLAGDLTSYARGAASSIAGPDGLGIIRGMIAVSDPATGVDSPLTARSDAIQTMLDRAAARGETGLAADDVIDGILAPLYLRRIFRIGVLDNELTDHLVAALLRGRAVPGSDAPRGSASTRSS